MGQNGKFRGDHSYLRRSRPNQTLQPTALINEAYLRLIDQAQPVRFESRAHFYGIAAHLMRQVLVDYSRSHYAAKRGSGAAPSTLDEAAVLAPAPPNILELDDALQHLADFDPRRATIIEMRYFGAMTRDEIAAALGVSVATVKRDLRLASHRYRFSRRIKPCPPPGGSWTYRSLGSVA